MLIFVMAAIFNNYSEARVYCQDTFATEFYYLGFSCPVNCYNVKAAVNRLKLQDDEKRKEEETERFLPLRVADPKKTFYTACETIFRNKTAADEVRNELERVYSKCRLVLQEKIARRNERQFTCFRRNYQQQFSKSFTNILNKHAHGLWKFTEEMTSLLLEKVLGDTDDVRADMNVDRLLQLLRKALRKHRAVAHSEHITLKSTHCLMTSVPGCYCNSGFVEQSGQCVLPADCLTGEDLKYVSRVHIVN